MIEMTLADIAAAVDGHVVDAADGRAIRVVAEAFVDSRQIVAGGLFVAVLGDHVDGHDYAAAAVHAGAAAVLAERPVGVPAVIVDDSVVALSALAATVVAQLPRLTVVGVTGSQGKTSTKDIIGQLLEREGETVATKGSFNNEIGAPLTALRVRESTEYLVCEMGARGQGHIGALAAMVRPRVGAVLNVGMAHMGEFGTQDDIGIAKRELVEALPADGLAILNADDARVVAMRDHTAADVITFGEDLGADVRVEDVSIDRDGHATFVLRTGDDAALVTVPLVGAHQAHNAAAAAAVALGLGMSFTAVVETLKSLTVRSHWRMEVSETIDGVTIINDAYNANPDSMRVALETLAHLGIGGGSAQRRRTVAVLGEMQELGDASRREHEAAGRLADRLEVSQLVVVGEIAEAIHRGAVEMTPDRKSVCVPNVPEAIAFLRGALRPGDVVLVKASRAAGLERVAEALAAGSVDDAGTGRDEAREADA